MKDENETSGGHSVPMGAGAGSEGAGTSVGGGAGNVTMRSPVGAAYTAPQAAKDTATVPTRQR